MFRVDTTKEIKYDKETMFAISNWVQATKYIENGAIPIGVEVHKNKLFIIVDKSSCQSLYEPFMAHKL